MTDETPYVAAEPGPVAQTRATARDLTIPALAAVLMFLAVMLGAAPLMQSVLEEKSQRIAEILISSLPPFQLMLGKLLGASAVSLLLLGVYFGGGYLVAIALDYGAWFTLHNVSWLLLASHIVRLLPGTDDDGSRKGNALKPAVQTVAAAVIELAISATPGRCRTPANAIAAPR